MAQDGLTAQAEIARLTFQLARYRGPSAHGLDPWGAEFGRSSEKLARDTEQLELALETLETDQAERLATASPAVAALVEAEAQKPARRPLPEHLPREDLRHPAPCTCPSCGGALRKISDEVTETLDYVPAGSRACPRESGGDPAHSSKALLPGLRHGGGGAGARPRDRARAGRGRTARSCCRVEIRRPLAAVSSGRDLRPRWGELGDLDPAFARAGSMFVTSGRLPVRAPRRRCSSTRPTATGSTRGHI